MFIWVVLWVMFGVVGLFFDLVMVVIVVIVFMGVFVFGEMMM